MGANDVLADCDGMLTIFPSLSSAGARLESDRCEAVRRWRMVQLQICFETATHVDLGCSSGCLACTAPFTQGGWEFGFFDPEIAAAVRSADWAAAEQMTLQKDLNWPLTRITTADGGISAFKARLSRIVCGPVLRQAAAVQNEASLALISEICGAAGFVVNGKAMVGSLGQTAVHISAAKGNLAALKSLLVALADPNVEDHYRETPLHYAAFAGQAAATKTLLKHGAVARAESAFAETPMLVAAQSPAGFLGVQSEFVHKTLAVWIAAGEEAPQNSYEYHMGIIDRHKNRMQMLSDSRENVLDQSAIAVITSVLSRVDSDANGAMNTQAFARLLVDTNSQLWDTEKIERMLDLAGRDAKGVITKNAFIAWLCSPLP